MSNLLLSPNDITNAIFSIVKESKKFCYIVSPFIETYGEFLLSINHSGSSFEKKTNAYKWKFLPVLETGRTKTLFFFINENQLTEKTKSVIHLNLEYNFDIFLIKKLHAKIYASEKEALITSMNFKPSSFENLEAGYITHDECELRAIHAFLAQEILPVKTNYIPGYWIENQSALPSAGFCIRCGTTIGYNKHKPFCGECFKKWNFYERHSYLEAYCHRCGKNRKIEQEIPFLAPFCLDCKNEFFSNFEKFLKHITAADVKTTVAANLDAWKPPQTAQKDGENKPDANPAQPPKTITNPIFKQIMAELRGESDS
jgi:hypothetical protein